MEVDKLIEFLMKYQGKGFKIDTIKQWHKYNNCDSIILNDKTNLVIHENPFDKKEISMWVESIN